MVTLLYFANIAPHILESIVLNADAHKPVDKGSLAEHPVEIGPDSGQAGCERSRIGKLATDFATPMTWLHLRWVPETDRFFFDQLDSVVNGDLSS